MAVRLQRYAMLSRTEQAYSDRTYVGMGLGPGLGLIQCQSIGPV